MKRIVTQETKDKISVKRKRWLADNPEKHPWKNSEKFKSVPCERVKEFLISKNISFLPEFPPDIPGRFFAVDIAFPDRKIIWEINGNQHYERDGTLKPYYQERHDLLVADGWIVYEIPYACCFNDEKIEEFIHLSMESPVKIEFDYFNYAPRQTKSLKGKLLKDNCPECGGEKILKSTLCRGCNNKIPNAQRVWPSIEEMRKLVFEMPASKLSELIGISDSMITRFCKKNNIEKPSLGYWAKKAAKEKGK